MARPIQKTQDIINEGLRRAKHAHSSDLRKFVFEAYDEWRNEYLSKEIEGSDAVSKAARKGYANRILRQIYEAGYSR